MKKMRFLSLLLLPLLLVGCNQKENFDSKGIEVARSVGEIGEFNLLTPANGFSTSSGFTFTWEAASNADYYSLEIANREDFLNDPDEVYVKESNLSQPKFDLTYSLPKKDINYFWRVTALNKDHTKKSNQTGYFFYESANVGELEIEIEEADDWELHKEGSYADISIDRNNFFGNNKNSLVIKFDKEHTCQGIPKSDGWIVITKTEDRELYGTDAFYFNFFYSGQDASVLVRVLDYDGEYWHKQVQISRNAKQTCIIKYEDFELRTAGTNIFNRRFDWEHIRYFEVVFERTFGDGVCLFSDIKAVQYDNYDYMFMHKMDFKRDDIDSWKSEYLEFEKTVSEDGNELTLGYNPQSGFGGWCVQYINLYKFFATGDAIRMYMKYTGSNPSALLYFRIYEEDGDTWQFKTTFKDLIEGDYKELILPLKSFQRLEGGMNGDGAKQFSYIKYFAIGISGNYSEGTLSLKDLEIIKLDDILPSRIRTVPASGCIEDFNDYEAYTEIYYYWDQSAVNKDEAMKLDTSHRIGGRANTYCAEFDYKADMEMAVYQLYMDTSAVVGKNALSLWLKDMSPTQDETKYPGAAYLQYEDIAAEMTIQLTLDTGEWYRYIIPKLEKEWHNYTISFSDFELNNQVPGTPNPLVSDHIMHMAFGFKYFFYRQGSDGKPDTTKPYPTYAIANPVYIDEIYLTTAAETTVVELPGTLKPVDNVITVDTFEDYATSDDLFDNWEYGNALDYNLISISDDVSTQGGAKSIKMQYKSYNSVSYVRNTQIAHNAEARGIVLDIKGDGYATVYININLRSGTSTVKLRYALTSIPTTWTRYELGYHLFQGITEATANKKIYASDTKDIESISFGIVDNNHYTVSNIYIDNLKLSKVVTYTANSHSSIAQEVRYEIT